MTAGLADGLDFFDTAGLVGRDKRFAFIDAKRDVENFIFGKPIPTLGGEVPL